MSVAREFVMLSILTACPLALGQSGGATVPAASHPLELRLTKPLQWRNDCLEINLERRNRSKSPIFLPNTQGILIYSSVIDTTNTLGQGIGVAWFSIYGLGDIVDPRLTRLAPHERKRDSLCLQDTFPVIGSPTGRRQVRLQGSVRIDASYVLDENAWNNQWNQVERTLSGNGSSEANNAGAWRPEQVMIEIPIPCKKEASKQGCASPPPILRGEHHIPIPDIPQ
jgi:hypothetical protein